ncbi:hypothetical protein [Aquisphaera insulae]|uniref:hypothetical protein n=1 Tax=Aquisphaera insulae TaxID=2712864 RepID=UPI0013EA94E8|nr:hypothetical protein [Aquisphaera insulae]
MADFRPQGFLKPSPSTEGRIGYQDDRVSFKGVLGFAAILVVVVVAAQYVLVQMMSQYGAQEAREKQGASPMLTTPWEVPGPRLQPDPAAERIQVQAAQREHLASYGWLDRDKGVAHIPIERAMDILAKSGLPEIKAPPAGDSPLKPPAEAEKAAAPPAAKAEAEAKKAP